MLSAVRYLDTLLQQDESQKSAFIRDLAQLWRGYDERMLRQRVLPPLLQVRASLCKPVQAGANMCKPVRAFMGDGREVFVIRVSAAWAWVNKHLIPLPTSPLFPRPPQNNKMFSFFKS